MSTVVRIFGMLFALIGRIWKSGRWGKIGVSVVGMTLLGAMMPANPKAAPSSQASSGWATSVPARQIAAVQSASDDGVVVRATPRPTNVPAPPKATATPRPTNVPPTATPNRTLALGVAVNVRTGPNAAFDKVTTLNGNEMVTVVKMTRFRDVAWYQIQTNDQTGWVSSEVVLLDGGLIASLPVSVASFVLPTAVPEPTAKPAPPAAAKSPVRYDPFGPDRDCGDFYTYAEAYAFFAAAGGPNRDPHRLDRDNDGIPCETLR